MEKGYSDDAAERLPRWEGNFMKYIYGIITPIENEGELKIRVGPKLMNEKELTDKLFELSERTGNSYELEFMSDDAGEESAAIIGRKVVGAYENRTLFGSYSVTRGSALDNVIKQSGAIIRDLEKLGFEGINKGDLYLISHSEE